MLNPKHKRYAERLRELIEEGQVVASLESGEPGYRYIRGEDNVKLNAWLTKTSNILETVFGSESPQFRTFREVLPKEGMRGIGMASEVRPVTGVLSGALDDLEHGFLIGQEFLIAGEVFDSILEQGKELVKGRYKDPAAVLSRVVIEDALRRLARRAGIADNQKASQLNDELKKHDTYPQIQWRLIQAWLDIGNAAAHGQFADYTEDDVLKMIEGIEQFLLVHLQT